MIKYVFSLLVLFALTGKAFTQTTTVFDYTFSGNGIETISPPPFNDGKIMDVLIQPDGKIIVAGKTTQGVSGEDFYLLRYNSNGTIDNTFGNNGSVLTAVTQGDEVISRLLLQPDGKILAYGKSNADICIARYNSDGSLDNLFGTAGVVLWDLTGTNAGQIPANLVLQSDDKIVLGATTYGHGVYNTAFTLARLNPDGSIDSTYSNDGIRDAVISFDFDILSDIAIQPDNKIIAAGVTLTPSNGNSIIVTAKFNSDGSYDFDYSGSIVIDTVSGLYSDNINRVILQPDGKIILGGSSTETDASRYLLIRYNNNGSRDNTFGTNGVVVRNFNSESHYLTDMVLMPNGKIVVMGNGFILGGHTHFARFNANGSTDNTFNSDGHAEVDISAGAPDNMLALAIQSDGKLIAAGYTDTSLYCTSVIARFTNNMIPVTIVGLNDYLFNLSSPLLYPNPLQQTEVLKYTLSEHEQISISLIDGQGKLVAEFVKNENRAKGEHEEILNLPPALPSGTYYIQIASTKGNISIKAIK